MKVQDVFNLKKIGPAVTGESPWQNNEQHMVGDILICGDRKWEVIDVGKSYQGCFGVPTFRMHTLRLKPIDHNDQPNVGDELRKLLT
jgi:hypothetical protein